MRKQNVEPEAPGFEEPAEARFDERYDPKNPDHPREEKPCGCCVPVCCSCGHDEPKPPPCVFDIYATRVEVIDNKEKLDRRLDLTFLFSANGATVAHPGLTTWISMPAKENVPVAVDRYITTVTVQNGSHAAVPLYAQVMDIDWMFPDRPEVGMGGPTAMHIACGMGFQEYAVDVDLRRLTLNSKYRSKVRIWFAAMPR